MFLAQVLVPTAPQLQSLFFLATLGFYPVLSYGMFMTLNPKTCHLDHSGL